MEKNFSPSKQRLIQYLDYKDIDNQRFYSETTLSNGFLDKESELSKRSIEKIISCYPDINLSWLIFGIGEMLVEKNFSEGGVRIQGDIARGDNNLVAIGGSISQGSSVSQESNKRLEERNISFEATIRLLERQIQEKDRYTESLLVSLKEAQETIRTLSEQLTSLIVYRSTPNNTTREQ